MKHIGIITEYNPFHNGHAYQLQRANELFPDKKCIVIMSGNYVQRGEPAIYNKYLRTECALAGGAAIVFELPLLGAISSAEHFATTSVLSLYKTGVIDTLCFGAETDDIDALTQIADILVSEPLEYKIALQTSLKNGVTFPKARANALATCFEHISHLEDLINQPNNILAIEYIKTIKRYQLNLKPVIIKRIGNGYHNPNLDCTFSSASAIRKHMVTNSQLQETFIPEAAAHILAQSECAKPLFVSDFYTYLQYAIWQNASSLERFYEVSSDLANRIGNIKHYPVEYDTLLDLIKHKNYTNTRLQRALLNIILGVTIEDMELHKHLHYTPYIRLLGFSNNASSILKEMKEQSTIPVINKVTHADKLLSKNEQVLFEKELYRNRLYEQVFYNKYGISTPTEQEHTVIISK